MLRWILALTFLWAAGCGKSFQEADAIYKDEKARLDELRAACTEQGIRRSEKTPFNRLKGETNREYAERHLKRLHEFIEDAEREHSEELEERERKVKRAYVEREAAK